MRRIAVTAVLLASLGMLTAACSGNDESASTSTERPQWKPLTEDEEATFEYVIPYGTGVSIENGQTVDLMPARLDAKVGDSIRIINKDYRNHEVGPFYVRANQTLAMRFTNPGTLIGDCAINDEGEVVIVVTE